MALAARGSWPLAPDGIEMFQHRLWSLWPSGRLHTSQVCGAPEALAAPGARWDGELGVSTVALGVVKPRRPRPL